MASAKLDSSHHTFLQALMRRGPVAETAAMTMYKSLVASNSGDGFVQFLGAINKELEYVQMEVKKVRDQYDGKEFYGIINTLPSKEAKLGTQFNQAQILFFTAVMVAIVQDPTASGVISSTGALNLRLEPQGESQIQGADSQAAVAPVRMSMQAKEDALSQLEAEKLLGRTDEGGVTLGVKAFLELRSVFRNLEVPFCEICNEAAIKAQLCNTKGCLERVHAYCLHLKYQSRNQRPKCRGCKIAWAKPAEESKAPPPEEDATNPPENNDAAEFDEEYTEPIATQEEPVAMRGTMTRIPRRRRSAVAILEDDEEDHAERNGHELENASPNVSTRMQIRSPAKRRSRFGAVANNEGDVKPYIPTRSSSRR